MRLGWLVVVCLGCASATPRPASDEVRRASVNGTDISYVVDGAGPPLVIIHGGLGDYRSFARAVPALAARRTVIRVSLRFHEPNPWPSTQGEAQEAYRVETHAADVAALVEMLGRGPADVLGHSYGGVVAAVLAQSRPELVRRLVLVEPSLYGVLRGTPDLEKYIDEESRWRDGLLAQLRAGRTPHEVLRVAFGGPTPAGYDALPEMRRRIFEANAQTFELILVNCWVDVPYRCADARQLEMPVLLIEGAKTSADMREINTALIGCLPDARRVVLPDAGHAIQFDAPEAMARAVLQFVAPGP